MINNEKERLNIRTSHLMKTSALGTVRASTRDTQLGILLTQVHF